MSNIACPFGPGLQKYWDNRYELFSKFDEGIKLDEQALFSITPEKNAVDHAKRIGNKTVLDGFGCVGGNTIAFARFCKKVFMIELDENRLAMAKHNASIYGVEDKIEFIHGDFFDKAPEVQADVLYLDPPWGGPEYKDIETFKLSHFSPDGTKTLDLAFIHFKEVVLRVPKNFDFTELKKYDRAFTVVDDFIGDKLVTKTVYFGKV